MDDGIVRIVSGCGLVEVLDNYMFIFMIMYVSNSYINYCGFYWYFIVTKYILKACTASTQR